MQPIPQNIQKRLAEIASIKLFSNLSLADLEPLLINAQLAHFRHSHQLLRQDEKATHLVGILSGQARIYRLAPDGREAVTRILSVGDTLFENVIFYNGPSPVYGEIVKEAEVLLIPAEAVRKYVAANPTFAVSMISTLAERTNQMMYQIEQNTLHSAAHRLGGYFLGAMLEQKNRPDGKFRLDFEKSMLAKHLGMTPETLSRTLKDLTAYGVEIEGKSVTIADPCCLCQFHDTMIARKCPLNGTVECQKNQDKSQKIRATSGK